MDKLIDYRGDCWRAYLDVSLRLRVLPPGERFEFIVERDKLKNMRKVVSHNQGEVLSENFVEKDVRLEVEKTETQKK